MIEQRGHSTRILKLYHVCTKSFALKTEKGCSSRMNHSCFLKSLSLSKQLDQQEGQYCSDWHHNSGILVPVSNRFGKYVVCRHLAHIKASLRHGSTFWV